MLAVVLSCIPLDGAAGMEGTQHQQLPTRTGGLVGQGTHLEKQAQFLLWLSGQHHFGSDTQHCWGQSLSKFSILLTGPPGLGIPHWLGKRGMLDVPLHRLPDVLRWKQMVQGRG